MYMYLTETKRYFIRRFSSVESNDKARLYPLLAFDLVKSTYIWNYIDFRIVSDDNNN